MSSDDVSRAYALAQQIAAAVPGSSLRESDASGPEAAADPRLRAQLAVIEARRLSQFSMAESSLGLHFWPERLGVAPAEITIFIERP
ncbi:MAG: hypothetical protein LBI49_19495, partial [Nocardiopsaceae bacterium]|nr:hypothetical protein [Nocardiopsaceae bacterium]